MVLTAAEQGNDHAIRAFLEEGKADVCDEEGFTPLMCASANGQDSTIRILLQRSDKAKVDAQNVYGWTSLMQAACYGHLSAVMLLLQNKADVNLRNCWGTGALVAAAQGGFTTVAKVCLPIDLCRSIYLVASNSLNRSVTPDTVRCILKINFTDSEMYNVQALVQDEAIPTHAFLRFVSRFLC